MHGSLDAKSAQPLKSCALLKSIAGSDLDQLVIPSAAERSAGAVQSFGLTGHLSAVSYLCEPPPEDPPEGAEGLIPTLDRPLLAELLLELSEPDDEPPE